MSSDAESIEVVRRLMQTLSDRDWEGFAGVIAEDCEWTSVPLGTTRHGPEELIEGYKAFTEAFPDFSVHALTLIAQDGIVANEWSASGTHHGPLKRKGKMVPPTGRSFTRTGVGMVEVRDGKIVRYRDYYDRQTLGEQLGLE